VKGYIDTEAGREEWRARTAKLRLFARYYCGDVYSHPAEWANGNGYATSVSPPNIYVNYARFLIDRLASFSFDRVEGVRVLPGGNVVSEDSGAESERFLAGFLGTTIWSCALAVVARTTEGE
jgi:hypothetical protein